MLDRGGGQGGQQIAFIFLRDFAVDFRGSSIGMKEIAPQIDIQA